MSASGDSLRIEVQCRRECAEERCSGALRISSYWDQGIVLRKATVIRCDQIGSWDRRLFIERPRSGSTVDGPSSHRATRRWPASGLELAAAEQEANTSQQPVRSRESTRPFHGKTSGGAIVLLLLLLIVVPLIVGVLAAAMCDTSCAFLVWQA
ncbi:hypothetical protein VTN96DRAFT_4917 [Rasamsonia emersonii]